MRLGLIVASRFSIDRFTNHYQAIKLTSFSTILRKTLPNVYKLPSTIQQILRLANLTYQLVQENLTEFENLGHDLASEELAEFLCTENALLSQYVDLVYNVLRTTQSPWNRPVFVIKYDQNLKFSHYTLLIEDKLIHLTQIGLFGGKFEMTEPGQLNHVRDIVCIGSTCMAIDDIERIGRFKEAESHNISF